MFREVVYFNRGAITKFQVWIPIRSKVTRVMPGAASAGLLDHPVSQTERMLSSRTRWRQLVLSWKFQVLFFKKFGNVWSLIRRSSSARQFRKMNNLFLKRDTLFSAGKILSTRGITAKVLDFPRSCPSISKQIMQVLPWKHIIIQSLKVYVSAEYSES